VNPGYILARTIYDLVETRRKQLEGAYPPILIMQNHGLVVVGETPEEIRSLNSEVISALEEVITSHPQMEPLKKDPAELEEPRSAVARAIAEAAAGPAPVTRAFACPELEARVTDTGALQPLNG